MVCIPCIVIPALLFVWHRWIQPVIRKIWNPYGIFGKDDDKLPWDAKLDKLNKDLVNDITDTWLQPDKKIGEANGSSVAASEQAKEGVVSNGAKKDD